MNWMPIVLLALLALTFPLYFIFRRFEKGAVTAAQVSKEVNAALYQERVAEIEALRDSNQIDPQQAEQLIVEQQRVLLEDAGDGDDSSEENSSGNHLIGRWSVVLLLVLVPVIAFGLYDRLGARADVGIAALLEERSAADTPEQSQQLTKQLIEQVSQRLLADPDNAGHRLVLARALLQDEQIAQSVEHYRLAAQQFSTQAEVQAEYAQAAYILENGQFTTTVVLAIDRALELDPGNVTALGLRGVKAFEEQDYATAISRWQLALQRLPAQSQQAAILSTGIQRARLALGEDLPGITVDLTLSEELEAQPEQIVFLFARQWQGPPMPLAVARLKVSDLPVSVKLDDTMAMPGGQPLSSVEKVEIVARVSSSGTVAPQAGDLQGQLGPLELKNGQLEEPVALKIDIRL